MSGTKEKVVCVGQGLCSFGGCCCLDHYTQLEINDIVNSALKGGRQFFPIPEEIDSYRFSVLGPIRTLDGMSRYLEVGGEVCKLESSLTGRTYYYTTSKRKYGDNIRIRTIWLDGSGFLSLNDSKQYELGPNVVFEDFIQKLKTDEFSDQIVNVFILCGPEQLKTYSSVSVEKYSITFLFE